MADIVAVDFENGAHMVLSKLVDGSAVKRVQVGDEVFVRELGTDVKHAYDRGWIAGWNAQHGDPNAARRVSTAVVIGPPGTDPGGVPKARVRELLSRAYRAGIQAGVTQRGDPRGESDAEVTYEAILAEVSRG